MKLAENNNHIKRNMEKILPKDADKETAKTEMSAYAFSPSENKNKQTEILMRAITFFETGMEFLKNIEYKQAGIDLIEKLKAYTPEGRKLTASLAAALVLFSGVGMAQAVPIERADSPDTISQIQKTSDSLKKIKKSSVKISRIGDDSSILRSRITKVDENGRTTISFTHIKKESIPDTYHSTGEKIKAPQYAFSKSMSEADNIKYRSIVLPMMTRIQNNLQAIGYAPAKPLVFSFDKKELFKDSSVQFAGMCFSAPDKDTMDIYLDRNFFDFSDTKNENMKKSCEAMLTHEIIHSLYIKDSERTEKETEYNKIFGEGNFGHSRNFQKAAFKYDEAYDIGVSDAFAPKKEQSSILAAMSWEYKRDSMIEKEKEHGKYKYSGQSPFSVISDFNWKEYSQMKEELTDEDIKEFTRITEERIKKHSLECMKYKDNPKQQQIMAELTWEYKKALEERAFESTAERNKKVSKTRSDFILQGLKMGISDIYLKAASLSEETDIKFNENTAADYRMEENNGSVKIHRAEPEAVSIEDAAECAFSMEM